MRKRATAILVRVWIALALASVASPLWAGTKEAAAYLAIEVPRWKPENGCYSCHNNGDGARALFLAGKATDASVADTLRFLRDPAKWPSDLAPLALIQYASALEASGEKGDPLRLAVDRLVKTQKPDGHWEMDAEAADGSPVTYGPVLGTVLARNLLLRFAPRYDTAVEKANQWLVSRPVTHPMDLAAIVLAFSRKDSIDRLAALQGPDGSWNGSEAFDTAIAVIALAKPAPEAAARGRAWLNKNQLGPGGWRGTTRPAGGQSYAQHISTTAWALIALLTGE